MLRSSARQLCAAAATPTSAAATRTNATRPPVRRRRFPPLIDTLITDGFPLRSDPPDYDDSTNSITDTVGAATHSVLRLSYNPSNAKVYMVRVPAELSERMSAKGGAHQQEEDAYGDEPSSIASSSNHVGPTTTTGAGADGKKKPRTTSSLINSILDEDTSSTAAGGGGATARSRPNGSRTTKVAAKSITTTNDYEREEDPLADDFTDDYDAAALRNSDDLPHDLGEAIVSRKLRLISDVDSKASIRLSPHHVASMLSAMDSRVAMGYWRSRNKVEAHQKDAIDLSKQMVHQLIGRVSSSAVTSNQLTAVIPQPLPRARDEGEEDRRQLKDRVPIIAGRDLYAPNHVDDDVPTFALMKAMQSERDGKREGNTVTTDEGGKAITVASGKTTTSPTSPSSSSYAPQGPRELQWFIDEARQAVTIVSTLTTRQYVLNTTGTFRLHKEERIVLKGKDADGEGEESIKGGNGAASKDRYAYKMRLRSVKLSGYAVDDSLLFFHCFGKPNGLVKAHYVPIKPATRTSNTQAAIPTTHCAPPNSTRKRIWSPIMLGPNQIVPFKRFLEASLDEAIGFGTLNDATTQRLRDEVVVDGTSNSNGSGDVAIVYFGGSQAAGNRLVVPQSVVRPMIHAAGGYAEPSAADDGADGASSDADEEGDVLSRIQAERAAAARGANNGSSSSADSYEDSLYGDDEASRKGLRDF